MTGSGKRVRNQVLGVVFLLLLAALGRLAVAVYDKTFSSTTQVVLHVDRAGNQLTPNADVKVRGVVVGSVRDIRTTGEGVLAHLAIDPDKLHLLPRNVSARLLPKTLFGQRYVNLVIPRDADSRRLSAGDVVEQDRSSRAIELEKALRDLLPVLQAVQPHKLAASLGAIAQALDGRGAPLGETLVALDAYLTQLNPSMPALKDDITKLATTLSAYEQAGPDIIDALSELTTTARTLSEQRQGLADLLGTVTTASRDMTTFLVSHKENLIRLAAASRSTLELLARYAPAFPCLFDAVTKLKPAADRVFGAGTGEPGLHVELIVKPPRPGEPAPLPPRGPRCYPTAGGQAVAVSDDLPNSPAENQFLAELLAPVQGVPVSDMPAWSSVLVGPLLRGTEVTLQ